MLAIPVWTLVPLACAMAIDRRIRGWRVFRAAFYFPTILSPVVIGLYFVMLLQYDGPVKRRCAASVSAASRTSGSSTLSSPCPS